MHVRVSIPNYPEHRRESSAVRAPFSPGNDAPLGRAQAPALERPIEGANEVRFQQFRGRWNGKRGIETVVTRAVAMAPRTEAKERGQRTTEDGEARSRSAIAR
ncbi:hypothetical protein M758_12G144700 [Ceratodon purpureus]|nr:hypothetical protein M758_12G144700 [Ceratodon purpureus]